MKKVNQPQAIFDRLIARDNFSQWLGLELIEIRAGYCKVQMKVREEMLNSFGILHGGVSYALADSTFAFASNSRGRISVSLNSTTTYTHPATTGDILTAEATEQHLGNRTASYDLRVSKQDGTLVCLFRGTVFRTPAPVLSD